ncbi:MAG: hypothetical protein ABSG68_02500, partial [Thermoguttaceae bacterium]
MTIRNPRRGVLLLVILGLLAMFSLVAVAFVIVSSQSRRSADTGRRVGQTNLNPKQDLDQAMREVLRGSNNPQSVIGSHSLLEDIYGNDPTQVAITGATPVCGGQLLEITLPATGRDLARRIGCVLTMTGGTLSTTGQSLAGLSTRIVGTNPTTGNPQILAFSEAPITGAATISGGSCAINGTPFSGMGYGYMRHPPDATHPTPWDACDAPAQNNGQLLALQPNNPENLNPVGGANSDYTAPDFQHMMLAYQVPNGSGVVTPIPSLHRPDLIQYWQKNNAGVQTSYYMLRPPQDPSHFTGSNPNFNPTWDGVTPGMGQWDVDNDGDGVPDSIWVDLGLPVRWTSDGRAFKPLFAILCLDMDGRLNLNAHGTLAQAGAAAYQGFTSGQGGFTPASANPLLARGTGVGPAEINLQPLFGSSGSLYKQLLQGSAALGLPGRYGSDGLPGPGAVQTPLSWNKWFDYYANTSGGTYWNYLTAATTVGDPYGSPPDPEGDGAVALDLNGTPLYLSCGGATLLNPYQIDLSRNAPHGIAGGADEPFGPGELERILRAFDRDASKLPNRLAFLSYDSSTTPPSYGLLAKRCEVTTESWSVPCPSLALSPSLRTTFGNLQGLSTVTPRHVIDMLMAKGVPQAAWSQLLPPEMLAGLKLNLSRPLNNWHGAAWPLQFYNTPTTQWTDPGGAFSLDPNGNTVAFGTDPATRPFIPGGTVAVGTAPTPAVTARLIQARYLYVLMTFLKDNGNIQVFSPVEALTLDSSTPVGAEFAARRIAQWAINAVCFSTPDSAMVPFKYPVNPSGGWCDNDLTNPYGSNPAVAAPGTCGVVWGCKPPELLLTETAAFHNRRVADTAWDDGTGDPPLTCSDTTSSTVAPPCYRWTLTDTAGKTIGYAGDWYLDQPRTPQGSAFVELYCPRSPASGKPPNDLYYYDATRLSWCVDLGRLAGVDTAHPNGTPSADGGVYPVWRLVVSKSTRLDPNNDVRGRLALNPDSCSLEPQQFAGQPAADPTTGYPPTGQFSLKHSTTGQAPQVKIDRIVWLAPQVPTTHLDANLIYYNRGAQTPLTWGLPCGSYAVVGPRPVTYVGLKVPLAPSLVTNSSQYITLGTSAGIPAGFYPVANYPAAQIKPTLSIIAAGGDGPGSVAIGGSGGNAWPPGLTAGHGIGFNISEPVFSDLNYYPPPDSTITPPPDPNNPAPPAEWYGDPAQGSSKFLHVPLESAMNLVLTDTGASAPPVQSPRDTGAGGPTLRPMAAEKQSGAYGDRYPGKPLTYTGTYPNYKTVFLQRIANPALPYDQTANPYLTVDWLPIDLTVFNGDDTRKGGFDQQTGGTRTWPPAWMNPNGGTDPTKATYSVWDPDDPQNDADTLPAQAFFSRQRGRIAYNAADPYYGIVPGQSNIYAPLSDDPVLSAVLPRFASNGSGENYPFTLHHTLGYLNTPFWSPAPPDMSQPAMPVFTSAGTGNYLGSPLTPFPWITWNARPYNNPMELLLVPATTAARLGFEFRIMVPTGVTNLYGQGGPVPHPHLLNFFVSSGTAGAAPQLHRILEYVDVPSRFVQTEVQMNPAAATGNPNTHSFHVPFQRIPTYREPGRINLNTISSQDVLQGLMNYYPGLADATALATFWPKFIASRHGNAFSGSDPGVDTTLPTNTAVPTRFAQPFRSSGGASLVPLPGLLPSKEI